MEVFKSEFIKSSSNYKDCPKDPMPEYAFIGRSNVGKSSLLNMLVNNKKLSKTSSKPGKTKLINHFMINKNYFLVDLPGYGWAKSSKSDRENWLKMTKSYLRNSTKLSLVFQLIDSRIEPQNSDIDFTLFLGINEIPLSIIFTKIDKIKTNIVEKNIELYKKKLLKSWKKLPEIFITSSKKQIGRKKILNYISEINNSILKR